MTVTTIAKGNKLGKVSPPIAKTIYFVEVGPCCPEIRSIRENRLAKEATISNTNTGILSCLPNRKTETISIKSDRSFFDTPISKSSRSTSSTSY